MKVQKMFFALILTFLSFSGMTTHVLKNPLTAMKCSPIVQLNKVMNEKLELTNDQMKVIRENNRDFWLSRKNIINTPEMLGQNTSLLACWDDWRKVLIEKLTPSQMEKFMQWQSQVDLLGESPF